MFPKSRLWIRWLKPIRQYTTYLVLDGPHFIFKSRSYAFYNENIGLFSVNDTRIAGYFVGMHRDMRMRTALLSTIPSTEFNSMSLNSKLFKVVSYTQNNKAWERKYFLSNYFSLVLGYFVLQIVTQQECKMFSTIP